MRLMPGRRAPGGFARRAAVSLVGAGAIVGAGAFVGTGAFEIARRVQPAAPTVQAAEAAPAAQAAEVVRVALHVEETTGIRRFFYPVEARVPFPAGALPEPAGVRLLRGGEAAPATFSAAARWPDGSVQWLAVNVNTSIGPLETQTFTLEYGPGVSSAAPAPRRGLTVAGTPDGIQVGPWRWGRTAAPLLQSAEYGGERIAPAGVNGIRVRDRQGGVGGVDPASVTVEVVRAGPQFVELRYAGRLEAAAGGAPFILTVGMPNSKSWFRAALVVDDPEARLAHLAFHTPVALGGLPLVWDVGTDRWTYGALRAPTDAARLTATVDDAGAVDWAVALTTADGTAPYEVSAGRSRVAGWGHLQGADHAVAFAMDRFASAAGIWELAVTGEGGLSLGRSVAGAGPHALTTYQHYVSTPVPIGAATSPTSMLHPLAAYCEPARYAASGVPAPAGR